MEDCIFCKIANGQIPSKKIYEDDQVFAFYDIEPQAPVHFLVIPKKHISRLTEIRKDNSSVIAHIYETISKIAAELNLDGGFRVVSNCGENGGQSVFHIHFHVLGGRSLAWPPG